MRRHRTKPHNKSLRNRRFFLISALLTVLIIISLLVNARVTPAAFELAKSYGSSQISETVNDCVSGFFDSYDCGYSDLVRLRYNSDGFVTAVEYDSAEINRMKTGCLSQLNKELSKLRTAKIKLPLGSLLDGLALSGRGPMINLRVSESAVPEIEVLSTFESVGVNQSRHEIMLRVNVDVSLIIPPKTESFTVTQDYVLAQTVIVGEVPSGCAFVE